MRVQLKSGGASAKKAKRRAAKRTVESRAPLSAARVQFRLRLCLLWLLWLRRCRGISLRWYIYWIQLLAADLLEIGFCRSFKWWRESRQRQR
jgi:hypothetical protein